MSLAMEFRRVSEMREKWISRAAGLCAIAMVATRAKAATGLLSSDYLPHRFCYLAKPWLVWTNVTADVLIGASYGLLFGCLLWIANRLGGIRALRKYVWICVSFGIFILTCGATHWMEVVTVWLPFYPLSAAFKVLCTAASVPTAVCFAKMTPLLGRTFEQYLETLQTAKGQRDSALVALNESEVLVQERDRVTKKLARAYRQLNAVLECTSDSVLSIGRDWTLLYANRNAIVGLPDIRLGADYWSCFPTMVGTAMERLLRNAMVTGSEAGYELYFEPYQQWFKARAFPTDEGLSVFFSNITEDKNLEAQLELERVLREKRIEALSHMAGGLAHEISNPLTIIHGRAFELRSLAEGDGPLSVEDVRIACDSIVKTADRATAILRGLRGFAHEGSHDPMELACMDEIVEECQEMQQSRFDGQGIEMRIRCNAETPLLMCRKTQVGQIVTNLLNNAFDAIVHAGAKERWVTVEAEQVGDEIWTDVTDSGPGIEDRFRKHLMEPFFTTKELGLGMGVGLSLSRAIAQDHGGSLALLEDTAQTCFRLILPLRQSAGKRATEEVRGGVLFN